MQLGRSAVGMGLAAITFAVAVTTACGSFSGDDPPPGGGTPPEMPVPEAGTDTSVGGEAKGDVVLAIPKDIVIVQGATLTVEVSVTRKPPFAKGMTITARGLPSGLGVAPVDITPSDVKATLTLVASKQVVQGPLKDVSLEATSESSIVGHVDVAGFVRGAAGDVDTTFGTNGVVDLGGADFDDMAMVEDGSLFVLATTGAPEVRKYTKDGALDKTFANAGVFVPTADLPVTAIAWRAPHLYLAGGLASNSQWHLQKMTAAGQPDLSYGVNGTYIHANTAPTPPKSLAISPTGAAAMSGQNGPYASLAYVTATGLTKQPVPADPLNFGFTRTAAGPAEFVGVAYDDTRIVAVGTGFVFRAIVANHLPDTSFAPNGMLARSGHDVNAVAVDAAGNYIIGGSILNFTRLFLARVKPNGVLDGTFGDSGEVVPEIAISAGGGALALTGDKIVQAGSVTENSQFRCSLARYLKDGSPDATFGSNGRVTPPVNDCYSGDVAAQPDGRLVLTGSKLLRFWP